MDEIWKKAVITAMAKKGYTNEQLAQELGIRVKELERILSGEYRISLEQLLELVELLDIDLNEALGLDSQVENDLVLSDDLEIKINEIARSIPKGDRTSFLRALVYLASCFYDDKES